MTNFNLNRIGKTLLFCLSGTVLLASSPIIGHAEEIIPTSADTQESPDSPQGLIPAPHEKVFTGLTPAEEISPNSSEGVILPGNLTQGPQSVLYECLASDPNCLIAYAINSNPNTAQARALSLCVTASPFNFCYARGCFRLP